MQRITIYCVWDACHLNTPVKLNDLILVRSCLISWTIWQVKITGSVRLSMLLVISMLSVLFVLSLLFVLSVPEFRWSPTMVLQILWTISRRSSIWLIDNDLKRKHSNDLSEIYGGKIQYLTNNKEKYKYNLQRLIKI